MHDSPSVWKGHGPSVTVCYVSCYAFCCAFCGVFCSAFCHVSTVGDTPPDMFCRGHASGHKIGQPHRTMFCQLQHSHQENLNASSTRPAQEHHKTTKHVFLHIPVKKDSSNLYKTGRPLRSKHRCGGSTGNSVLWVGLEEFACLRSLDCLQWQTRRGHWRGRCRFDKTF